MNVFFKFKTILKYSLLFCVINVLCFSCSTDDEQVYSCNKETNEWVKQHIPEIRNMKRQDWLVGKLSHSRAIYNAFTQKQKVEFWRDKLTEVMTLSWSKAELAHIMKLLKYVNTHQYLFGYSKLTEEQVDDMDLFFYEWQSYAVNNLNWKKSLCIAIAGTGYKVKNKNGDIELHFSDTWVPGGVTKPSCNCNTGTLNDFCGSTGPCIETKCEGTSVGCGWLLTRPCNGECEQFA